MNEEYKSNNSKKGRWTKEEQNLFNFAYQWHGKDWKKLAEIIPSRSIIQIRSHAQKIQKKIDKTQNSDMQPQKIYILEPVLEQLNEYISSTCSNSFKKYIEHQNTLIYSQTNLGGFDHKVCEPISKAELNSS